MCTIETKACSQIAISKKLYYTEIPHFTSIAKQFAGFYVA